MVLTGLHERQHAFFTLTQKSILKLFHFKKTEIEGIPWCKT